MSYLFNHSGLDYPTNSMRNDIINSAKQVLSHPTDSKEEAILNEI